MAERSTTGPARHVRRSASLKWRLLVVLTLVATAVVMVSLVLPRVTSLDVLRDPASPIVQFVDARAERNLHTWLNVILLGVAAAAHLAVSGVARTARAPAWPWVVTATLLAALSLDDMTSLHEQLEPLGRSLGAGDGALHFAWVLPGLALGAGVLVAAVATARRLPAASARYLWAGVLTLLTAGLGLEAIGGLLLSEVGDGPAYILVSHAEEYLETLAAVALLAATLAAVDLSVHPTSGVTILRYAASRSRPPARTRVDRIDVVTGRASDAGKAGHEPVAVPGPVVVRAAASPVASEQADGQGAPIRRAV